MGTWLASCFAVATVALFVAAFAWMIVAPVGPPPWLWGLALAIGFTAAVLCHIYNAAHDSLLPRTDSSLPSGCANHLWLVASFAATCRGAFVHRVTGHRSGRFWAADPHPARGRHR